MFRISYNKSPGSAVHKTLLTTCKWDVDSCLRWIKPSRWPASLPIKHLTPGSIPFLKWQRGQKDEKISKNSSLLLKSINKKVYTLWLEKHTLTDIIALCTNNIYDLYTWREWWWWKQRQAWWSWWRVVGLFHARGRGVAAGLSALQHTRWSHITCYISVMAQEDLCWRF